MSLEIALQLYLSISLLSSLLSHPLPSPAMRINQFILSGQKCQGFCCGLLCSQT